MSIGIGTILSAFANIAKAIHTKSKNHALSEIRKENGNCLHIFVKEDMGNTFYDLSGPRDINLRRGALFLTHGFMFYHPNPFFTPVGNVEALCRSQWKEGGLNPENSSFPVVEDGSYKGYFWRKLSGDKGGGETRLGYCALCNSETSAIEA